MPRRAKLFLKLAGLFTVLTTVLTSVAMAQCDMPLVIRRTAGEANVMIVFDNSGSMNEAMLHSAYNPGVTYSGNFTSTTMYYVSSTGNKTPRSFNGSWPNSPTAYLVRSDAGQSGRYLGNYLNWVFFHATSSQRAAIPQVTRIQVAKSAVTTVINAPSNINYGVTIFNFDNGGTVVAPIGTPKATLTTTVNAVAGDSWTPLAETMVTVMNHYQLTGPTAPIKAQCQKAFMLVVTDGLPTMDLSVPGSIGDYDGDGLDPGNCTSIGAPYSNSNDCSHWMDDVATYMFANDMRPDLAGFQNVTTYVIGFNENGQLLQDTATKGGGQFFLANDAAQLSLALNNALNIIETKVAAGTAVSVVSAEDRTQNRLFRARFESVSWRGFMEAYDLPYTNGDSPAWQGGELLKVRNPSTRSIFTTTTGSNKIDFTTSNASTLQSALGAASTAEATDIIDYTRGSSVTGTRDRNNWKLGDIVDSSPVTVGKPSAYNSYLSYGAFRTSNAGRTEVIYVGSNDGMMHCFNAGTGAEEWAYVPKNQQPRIKNLMNPWYCHQFFVNMTPAVYDVHVGGSWKTMLIGGEERGGSGLFALNVTDPTASAVTPMWDVNIPSLSGSWTKPALVRDKTLNKHVLVAGTGLDSLSGLGKLFVLDPANGSTIATHSLGTSGSMNMVTEANVLDLDFDGYDDVLYAGDIKGKLWRVNLKTNPWTTTLLFNGTQPIQAAPVVTVNEAGYVMLFFGTGRYVVDADLFSTGSQAIYAVVDDHSGSTLVRADLVNQTSTINPVPSSAKGWYVDLVQYAGERVTRKAALISGTLYIPSFRPKAGVCEEGGESWLYSLDYNDGSAPDNHNGTENNTTTGRVKAMGDGVLSNPSVDLVNEDIILQSSNTTMITQDIDVALRRLVVRSWRQRWN